MTTQDVICRVTKVWGVSPERKLNAIRLLLGGKVTQQNVVELVDEMERREGALHAAQQDLNEVNERFDGLFRENSA